MLLIFGLFIVPRALQRYRLPSAITCLGFGALLSMGFGLFDGDPTIKFLATLGIVTMFLFAGLEVDFHELRKGKKTLIEHLIIQFVMLIIGTVVIHQITLLERRPSLLFALALLTPSTGFILDSLNDFKLSDEEKFGVKSKAIATELMALGVLFITTQSTAITTLAFSTLVLVLLVVVIPHVFHIFACVIAPFAPKTEFSFLIIMALLCAYITRELGVYYLVGAFIVGLTAVRLQHELPELSSTSLMQSVGLFSSFFIPFYFFKSGLHLRSEYFTWSSIKVAIIAFVFVTPIKIGSVAIYRRYRLLNSWGTGLRIGSAMTPTLVFTIVIADILQERFNLSPELFGGLILFALSNTVLSGVMTRFIISYEKSMDLY